MMPLDGYTVASGNSLMTWLFHNVPCVVILKQQKIPSMINIDSILKLADSIWTFSDFNRTLDDSIMTLYYTIMILDDSLITVTIP